MAGNDGRLPGFMLPEDWYAMLMSLDDATLAALIRAAIRYANSDGPDGQDGQDGRAGTEAMGLKAKAAPLWLIMRAEIDRQIERRERVIAGTRKAINARWERQKANTQTVTDPPPPSSGAASGHGPTRTERGDDTNVYERIRTNTNVYERIRTYDGDNPEPENTDSESHKQRNDNDKMRTHANACERIRTNTCGGGRAGGEGTVLSSTKTLSEKENVQKKNGPDGQDGPDGHDGQVGRKKPEKRERIVRILMHFIRRYYHRRKTTAWSSKEMSQVRKIAERSEAVREMIIIGRAYRSDYRYARHDIITLLNNWTTELDRASIFSRDNRERRSSHGGRIEQRYGMQ